MPENNQSETRQERQLDKDQYEMLLRCSEKKDMTEWNEWREANKKVPIFLQKADFLQANLRGAHLRKAHLEGACLVEAYLEGADLIGAHLERADLIGVHLEGAKLLGVHLEGADLAEAHLEGAHLFGAHLEDASLFNTHLEGAYLTEARLEKASFREVHLEGANIRRAILDGKTLIWGGTFDEHTDFTGVGLDSARVEPRLKVNLQGNIRRKQWEEWYKEGSKRRQFLINPLVKLFWWISNYGRSTGRIIGCFFGLSIMFALFYYLFGLFDGQGIVANLFVDYNAQSGNPVLISPYIIPIRTIYFSIVTMTTLGFGDMYAQPGSYLGHILLTIQVLLGYILLGALDAYGEVTKQAVMLKKFFVEKEGKPLIELAMKAPKATEHLDDPEMAEWAVGVNWIKTFPIEEYTLPNTYSEAHKEKRRFI